MSYLNAEVWTVPISGPKREKEVGKLGLLSEMYLFLTGEAKSEPVKSERRREILEQ